MICRSSMTIWRANEDGEEIAINVNIEGRECPSDASVGIWHRYFDEISAVDDAGRVIDLTPHEEERAQLALLEDTR